MTGSGNAWSADRGRPRDGKVPEVRDKALAEHYETLREVRRQS
jgi:hypothetical protein